jgi:tetratricopeptide (TPR) repeat protein
MLRGCLVVVLLVCAVVASAFTQLARPNPVRLRIQVTYENGMDKVRDANVELMDTVGGGSSTADRKLTDQDGRVEFNTFTGGHRIRITADGAYPYEGEFLIESVETFHVELIRMRRKPDAQQPIIEERTGTATVPLVRLKIPEKARKEFEKGGKALEQKNWAESRKDFQAAIDLYNDYDLAYNGLGVACTELKDLAAAQQAFRKAVKLNDKFAEAQRNLARLVLAEHKYEEVDTLLTESLTAEPNNAWALTNAAYAELNLHRFKQASEHALRVHTLPHEGLANAHVIAAYALEELGQPQEAVEQWKLYLKEDPNGPNARHAQDKIGKLAKSP